MGPARGAPGGSVGDAAHARGTRVPPGAQLLPRLLEHAEPSRLRLWIAADAAASRGGSWVEDRSWGGSWGGGWGGDWGGGWGGGWGCGCGWLRLSVTFPTFCLQVFVPTSEVDLVWEEVVRALWEGKLGHTAKVSGAGPNNSGSHVICIYVDPFWEEAQPR